MSCTSWGLFDQMMMAKYDNLNDTMAKFWDNSNWLDTFEMIYNSELRSSLFNEIMENNSVFMTNGLFAHYFFSHIPRYLIRGYTRGIDYHVSRTQQMKCYFLNIDSEYFGRDNLVQLNKM